MGVYLDKLNFNKTKLPKNYKQLDLSTIKKTRIFWCDNHMYNGIFSYQVIMPEGVLCRVFTK
jgi:hypothetical protein